MSNLIIPLNDWAAGERKFHSHVGLEFFQTFDNSEILDASVEVDVAVRKEGMRKVKADLHLHGTVTVPCDRCLEPFDIPVEASELLDAESEELLSADGELDLRQAVYDYVCLSLPIQRVHPEGACNPDTVRFLGHPGQKDEEAGAEQNEANSPFAALKGLFDSK